MNKMYLAIIGFLLIIALLVGGYAFYKTANQIPISYQPPVTTPTTTISASPVMETKPIVPLTITSFKDGDVVTIAKVTVKGQTTPNADVAVNNADLKADEIGNFSTSVGLEEGDNAIEVVASDTDGNNTAWTATVTYTPVQ